MKKWMLALVLLGVAFPALATDHYYLWMFGYQGPGRFNLPRHSHSFALFVKVDDQRRVEHVPISWLPRDLQLRINDGPEVGTNLDIPATFNIIQSRGYRWQKYGPYEIQEGLYRRAEARVEQVLRPRKMLYEARPQNRKNATNCIHAISDLDTDRGWLNTGRLRGFGASAALVGHFNRWRVKSTPPADLSQLVTEQLGFPAWYLR